MAGWNRCCRVGYFLFRWYSCGSAMVLFKSLVEGRLGLVTSHIAYGVYCIGIRIWFLTNKAIKIIGMGSIKKAKNPYLQDPIIT
jgi:hypothetical protein